MEQATDKLPKELLQSRGYINAVLQELVKTGKQFTIETIKNATGGYAPANIRSLIREMVIKKQLKKVGLVYSMQVPPVWTTNKDGTPHFRGTLIALYQTAS